MVVAGTTQIGVVEQRGGAAVLGGGGLALRARREATPLQLRTPSSTARADTASTRTGSRPRYERECARQCGTPVRDAAGGEHGADQAFGVGRSCRPNGGTDPASTRRSAVGAGHMVGVRAVLAAHVTALMDADASAPMEDLDGSRGDPHVDLGADERVRNGYRKSWTSM